MKAIYASLLSHPYWSTVGYGHGPPALGKSGGGGANSGVNADRYGGGGGGGGGGTGDGGGTFNWHRAAVARTMQQHAGTPGKHAESSSASSAGTGGPGVARAAAHATGGRPSPPAATGASKFRCKDCSGAYDTLVQLTVHMSETGHYRDENVDRDGHRDRRWSKARKRSLVDMESEREAQKVLKCMCCGHSFESLQDLSVHMIRTKHYQKLPLKEPFSAAAAAGAGHAARPGPAVKKKAQADGHRLGDAGSERKGAGSAPSSDRASPAGKAKPGQQGAPSNSRCGYQNGASYAWQFEAKKSQILKCMECGSSHDTLQQLTAHMMVTGHFLKVTSSALKKGKHVAFEQQQPPPAPPSHDAKVQAVQPLPSSVAVPTTAGAAGAAGHKPPAPAATEARPKPPASTSASLPRPPPSPQQAPNGPPASPSSRCPARRTSPAGGGPRDAPAAGGGSPPSSPAPTPPAASPAKDPAAAVAQRMPDEASRGAADKEDGGGGKSAREGSGRGSAAGGCTGGEGEPFSRYLREEDLGSSSGAAAGRDILKSLESMVSSAIDKAQNGAPSWGGYPSIHAAYQIPGLVRPGRPDEPAKELLAPKVEQQQQEQLHQQQQQQLQQQQQQLQQQQQQLHQQQQQQLQQQQQQLHQQHQKQQQLQQQQPAPTTTAVVAAPEPGTGGASAQPAPRSKVHAMEELVKKVSGNIQKAEESRTRARVKSPLVAVPAAAAAAAAKSEGGPDVKRARSSARGGSHRHGGDGAPAKRRDASRNTHKEAGAGGAGGASEQGKSFPAVSYQPPEKAPVNPLSALQSVMNAHLGKVAKPTAPVTDPISMLYKMSSGLLDKLVAATPPAQARSSEPLEASFYRQRRRQEDGGGVGVSGVGGVGGVGGGSSDQPIDLTKSAKGDANGQTDGRVTPTPGRQPPPKPPRAPSSTGSERSDADGRGGGCSGGGCSGGGSGSGGSSATEEADDPANGRKRKGRQSSWNPQHLLLLQAQLVAGLRRSGDGKYVVPDLSSKARASVARLTGVGVTTISHWLANVKYQIKKSGGTKFLKHMDTDHPVFYCAGCALQFRSPAAYVAHLESHLGFQVGDLPGVSEERLREWASRGRAPAAAADDDDGSGGGAKAAPGGRNEGGEEEAEEAAALALPVRGSDGCGRGSSDGDGGGGGRAVKLTRSRAHHGRSGGGGGGGGGSGGGQRTTSADNGKNS
ncbi:teashirt homolog 3-like [Lethenteron reissneri]|uniref:teashirt homolog 3-like n=1 Tax=Lethenteron reissneri TaxID=7753 RepID=UPI002AB76A51|nr:teashirt homolog 3-like [Lethenteron reissneri]